MQMSFPMVNFIVKKLPYELSSHSGLALVGKYPKQINLPALLDPRSRALGSLQQRHPQKLAYSRERGRRFR